MDQLRLSPSPATRPAQASLHTPPFRLRSNQGAAVSNRGTCGVAGRWSDRPTILFFFLRIRSWTFSSGVNNSRTDCLLGHGPVRLPRPRCQVSHNYGRKRSPLADQKTSPTAWVKARCVDEFCQRSGAIVAGAYRASPGKCPASPGAGFATGMNRAECMHTVLCLHVWPCSSAPLLVLASRPDAAAHYVAGYQWSLASAASFGANLAIAHSSVFPS